MANEEKLLNDILNAINNISNSINNGTATPGSSGFKSRARSKGGKKSKLPLETRREMFESEINGWDTLSEKAEKYKQQLSLINKEREAEIKKIDKIKELISAAQEKYDNATTDTERENAKRQLNMLNGQLLSQEEALRDIDRESYEIEVNRNNIIKERRNTISEIVNKTKNVVLEAKKLSDAWGKVDQAAANYAKSIGTSSKGMESLRDNTLKNVTKSKMAIRYDISADELIKLQQNIGNNLGRNIQFSNEGQEDFAAMNKVMGESASDMAVKFENFGMSIRDAAERSGKMFSNASKAGISFEKYSKNFLDNITIAQNYTFKNGLKGLESMAKKATAIRLDMQQVAAFAEKVQTVEGALDTSAKLQVLGGSFASLSDPMSMMYEGLNDMEGLTDRVAKMIQGMGRFNSQTGEIDISQFNKQRVRAAANAMGMDYSKLMESVNATARRDEIERQINVAGRADLSDEMKELIKNTGTIQNGKAGVNIDGKFVELSKLDNDYEKTLIAQTQSESDNIRDIAIMLRGWNDTISGLSKQKDNEQARLFSGVGKFIKGAAQVIGSVTSALWAIVALQTGAKMAKGVFESKDLFDKLGKGKGKEMPDIDSFPHKAKGRGKGFRGTKIGRTLRKGRIGTIKAGRALSKAGSKLFSKIGATTLKSVGKGVGIGTVATLAGEGVGLLRDSLIEKGKIEQGKGTDNAMTVGKGLLSGTGLGIGLGTLGGALLAGTTAGSVLPGIGTAIGAIGGLTVGLVQMGKRKAEANMNNALNNSGLQIQGKYKTKEMKSITSGLANGQIDDKLRAKLLSNGDTAILDEIDRRRAKESKIMGQGMGNGFTNATISNASIRILSCNLNPSDIIKPKSLTNTGSEIVKERTSYKRSANNRNNESLNININGTIKLEGANGNSVDISDKLINTLLRNDSFVQKLSKMVDYEIRLKENGSFRKQNIGDGRYSI